jgi:glutamine synthetase
MVFLVMLCAVIKAVDKYSKLLRASVANSGNEHRLGGHEAPPAIISIFLGDQLTDIVNQLAEGSARTSKGGGELKLGVSVLPPLPRDYTDRNRTSPFAFTGNKFEFRMVGSSQSTAGPAFVINTIVADVLSEVADQLEKTKDVQKTLQQILKDIAANHRRIIFNGDNYTHQWVKEAEKRLLPNIQSTVEALSNMMNEENVAVFEKQGVLSREELKARTEILLDAYSMSINIEAETALNIAGRQIVPAVNRYYKTVADTVSSLLAAGAKAEKQKNLLQRVGRLTESLADSIVALENAVNSAKTVVDCLRRAESYRDNVTVAMKNLRSVADQLETVMDSSLWPLPSYAEMMFLK